MEGAPSSCCPPGSCPYLAATREKDDGIIGDADGVPYYQIGSSDAAILCISDVFGWNSGRVRAIADHISKEKGLSVWIPKILTPYEGGTSGDGLPPDFKVWERFGELIPLVSGDWGPGAVLPMCHKVIEKMKSEGVKKIACLGFCYGGWIGFHLAKEGHFVCGASAHPSTHLEGAIGGDPAALAADSGCPFALYPCGEVGSDQADPEIYDVHGSLFTALEAKFPGENVTKRFTTMAHGFVTRGSEEDEPVKQAIQECVDNILEFYNAKGLIPTA